jgi:hypothetical protein
VEVRQGEVPIPYEVVAHTGVGVVAVHLRVDVEAGVGRKEGGHLLLLEEDSQSQDHGHIALKRLVGWLEGLAATHKQAGTVAHELRVGKRRWGEG